jgi:hypothetical protein
VNPNSALYYSLPPPFAFFPPEGLLSDALLSEALLSVDLESELDPPFEELPPEDSVPPPPEVLLSAEADFL